MIFSIITVSILFWIAVFTLFSGTMCWLCEQKFQSAALPDEEMLWSRFRDIWFGCELVGIILIVGILLTSFIVYSC